MDIVSSDIHMSSTRVFARQVSVQQSMDVVVRGPGRQSLGPDQADAEDRVDFASDPARIAQAKKSQKAEHGHAGNDPRTEVLVAMIEALTGKKVRLLDPGHFTGQSRARDVQSEQAPARPRAPEPSEEASFGLSYDFRSTTMETETTTFNAEGRVRTADGRDVEIDVSLTMNRTFVQSQSFSMQAGSAKLIDPLVVNFSGTAAQLTSTTFDFDIDMDGRDESLHLPTGGSGFLALDRDENGKVTDGAELFGPRTNHGFQELKALDDNQDNWIDESDPVFPELRVWSRDENGNDRLHSLGKLGIGAIYLGRVDSAFSLTGLRQELMAQVHSTGLFVREDGTAGTVQELDLSV
jgi:hypothetical protein